MADPYSINPLNLPRLDDIAAENQADAHVLGGYLAKNIVEIPSLPTTMYGIGSKIIKNIPSQMPILGPAAPIVNSMRDEEGMLPGEKTAKDVSDYFRDKALEVGGDVAGRPLQPGLLIDNPPVDKMGTVLDIAANVIPVTGGPIKAGFEALKKIDTGIKAIDKTVPVIAEAAALMSPLAPTNNPGALIAGNVLIGGGLTAAVDTAQNMQSKPSPTSTPMPDDETAIQQFRTQFGVLNTQVDQAAAEASDVATHGLGEAIDTKKDLDIQNAVELFRATDWTKPLQIETNKQAVIQAGIPDLGDYNNAALGITGIVVAAGAAYLKRDVVRGKTLEWLGGKEFSKEAKLDAVSKPNDTALSVGDVRRAQTTDASLPLTKTSLDPEMTRKRFEDVASAWNVQSTSLHADGTLANSNVRLNRPLGDFVEDMKQLSADPVKLKLFQDAANAFPEQGNRMRAWLEDTKPVAVGTRRVDDPILINEYINWLAQRKQGIAPGTATTQRQINDVEAKYAFHSLDPSTNTVSPFTNILATHRLAMADPVIAPLLNEYKDITKKVGLDYRLEKGLITKKEYSDLSNLHPSYYPVRIQGKHMSILDLSTKGGRLVQGDTIKELFPYIEETVKDVAHAELKRSFIMEMKDRAHRGDTRAIELLGRDDIKSTNPHNKDKLVEYRDYVGKSNLIEIRDPLIRHALRPEAGTAALRLNTGMLRVLSFPSRALEELTTGPTAAIVGSPFALANAAYGSVATLINRPKGTVAGLLDRMIQDVSGKKVGFRGDPTFYAQVAAQMLPNVLAVLSKNGAMALEAAVRNNSWFSQAVGSGTLDATAKSLSNFYKASVLHSLESRGLHGGATPMARNTAPTMKELEDALSPSVKMSEGWQMTRNFLHDLFGAVGNAPQSAFFKQNQGRMSDELLTTRTRNVMGDPSKSGLGTSNAGNFVVGSTVAFPWGGVTLQSMSRFSRAIRENPAGTAAAIFTTIALPSMLMSNWNANLGPEYTDYEYRGRTPDQVSGSYYIGIPGAPPEEGLEIRVDQLMRPFKVLTHILYGHAMGLMDGSAFKPENPEMLAAIKDSMSTRYNLTGDAMKSAVGQILPAVPVYFNVAAGAMGFDQLGRTFTDPPTKIVDNKMAGATDSTSKVIDNKWFGYDISSRFESILNAVGGQVGRGIYETLTAVNQGKKDGLTALDSTKDYGDRFMMNLGQSTREVSGLWGHASTISPSQEASSKALQEETQGLKKLEAASMKLRSLAGAGDVLTGAKGREIEALTGSGPVQFKDQQMYALAFDAQRFMNLYNRQYAGEVKSLYEQRTSIQSSEKVTPEVKQQLVNDVSKKIIEVNRQALSAVNQWKWNVSKTYGRDIDLRNIELDKPITQFKTLLPQ